MRVVQDIITAAVFLAAFVGIPAFALWAFQAMTGLLTQPI